MRIMKTKKPIFYLALIMIIGLSVLGYFMILRNGGSALTIANYRINLPEGWESETVQDSIIDVYPGGLELCLMEPKVDAAKTQCEYVYVHPKDRGDFKIVIADTDKIPLGGGGFVTSITEKIDLGREDTRGTFNFVFRGSYENPDDPGDERVKTLY